MRVEGEWYHCDDGLVRPVIRGDILTGDGSWWSLFFLVDTGADRTVLSAEDMAASGLLAVAGQPSLRGVGGKVETTTVEAQIRFPEERLREVRFQGQFAAFVERDALDMSVLGRDITDIFALIVDRPGENVCLLGQRHGYNVWAR